MGPCSCIMGPGVDWREGCTACWGSSISYLLVPTKTVGVSSGEKSLSETVQIGGLENLRLLHRYYVSKGWYIWASLPSLSHSNLRGSMLPSNFLSSIPKKSQEIMEWHEGLKDLVLFYTIPAYPNFPGGVLRSGIPSEHSCCSDLVSQVTSSFSRRISVNH